MTAPEIEDDPNGTCWACGGFGSHADECDCGEATCCCLHPKSPVCEECGGEGWL